MAEGILKRELSRRPDTVVYVGSAGTQAVPGTRCPDLAVQIARQAGIDLSRHTARQIDLVLIEQADLILVMAPEHRQLIAEVSPQAGGKVWLLKQFGRLAVNPSSSYGEEAVPDPFGGSPYHYRTCFNEIHEEILRILPLLTA